MEDQYPPPSSQFIPQQGQGTPNVPPQSPMSTPPSYRPPSFIDQYKIPLAIGGIILIISLMTIVVAALAKPKAPPARHVAATTPTPTPTPVREFSPVASQSAFIDFSLAVASLSASVQNLNVYDSALAPPVLDLELGFR